MRAMNFKIGDSVQVGARLGAITDVGTLLIQYKTNDGGLRVACPWEVVKIPPLPQRVSRQL
jgi:isopenicillin N synthase-like dioxygenase